MNKSARDRRFHVQDFKYADVLDPFTLSEIQAIRPESNHPLRSRTAPAATPVDDRSPLAQAALKQTFFWEENTLPNY